MGDVSLRHDRLLSLLPRIYAAQGENGNIGSLLRTMAASLTRLDDDLTRLLHDRWVGLATGEKPGSSALERLAGLVDVPRLLSADAAGREDTEAYRRRVVLTANTVIHGLTAPRPLLSLAITALGLEPCPHIETHGAGIGETSLWRVEATKMWGMVPGTRKACATCRGGDCANADKRRVEAWITENPVMSGLHEERQLALWQDFSLLNSSLAPDRPSVTLAPLPGVGDVGYPALQNRSSGEILLYADVLAQDEILTIWPQPMPGEAEPFDNFDDEPHHEWLANFPNGRAFVTDGQGRVREVGDAVFLIAGSRFDDLGSVFGDDRGGTRFSSLEAMVRTPLLGVGKETWRLFTLPDPASRFDNSRSRYAGPRVTEGTRFAQWDGGIAAMNAERARLLFDNLAKAERDAAADPNTGHLPPAMSLRLDWVRRPPATFRLRIPRNEAVVAAERRGALDLIRDAIQQARAAGVRALVDFPQPPWRDSHAVDDGLAFTLGARWRDDAAPGEGALRFTTAMKPWRETQSLGDGTPVFGGRFDVTRLDSSTVE